MALAWFCLALASENPSQSQSQQSWPGLVWLWLEPWLEFGNADPFPTSILTFFVQKGMSRFGRAQSEPQRMTPEYIPKLLLHRVFHCQIGHPTEAGSSHGFLAWLGFGNVKPEAKASRNQTAGLAWFLKPWLGLAWLLA
ncbi:hypothetical protein C8R43DRAFT_940421 [Mycena crocata]|nr:hypothetical protein C8R43DRAFT_940421 [Mycena crocata]